MKQEKNKSERMETNGVTSERCISFELLVFGGVHADT
jgi:hypothetical protein